MRETVLEWVKKYKIVAIVRGAAPEQCMQIAEALYQGGIRLMEITYNQKDPDSWQKTADAIGAVAEAYKGRLLVGAGTVTSHELVEMTAKAGGLFIISPDTDVEVIKKTREMGLVSMPGALTPSEIKVAYNAGADFVKVFPIGNLGSAYLKAVLAPLGHIPMMAVGGVNEKNIGEYLAAGACGAGIGGNLANAKWIAAGEYEKITEVAKALVEAVKEFENK